MNNRTTNKKIKSADEMNQLYLVYQKKEMIESLVPIRAYRVSNADAVEMFRNPREGILNRNILLYANLEMSPIRGR